jgi:hypothetical protein
MSSQQDYIQVTDDSIAGKDKKRLSIPIHNSIEKRAKITYTEISSQPEPGCLRKM